MNNASKPTTSYSNVAKVASYETWATIPTTWATETRTWQDMGSLFENASKQSSSITNVNKP